MLANVRNNSNLFLESDKSVHCPSIYHLDLDIHIDTHKDSSSSWFFFNFFIFARLVVFSLLFLIMIQTIGGLNLWMVKGWVMVVVKVIMVMMVNGCSDGLGKLFQKFIVIFFWFFGGGSNTKLPIQKILYLLSIIISPYYHIYRNQTNLICLCAIVVCLQQGISWSVVCDVWCGCSVPGLYWRPGTGRCCCVHRHTAPPPSLQ